ncbi:hypothetical protein BOX15_Mlig015485g1 [Macrostomum lignano]|uniref:Uncharacterized protein n=1 Tax=Macrostomum lignano TaxID=282301 RepID=A0A267F4R3_9PLAT|nr:hypothetical protein BOX15_Mlig015485g2 [Macrostomum lignano]PAA68022.1 hypothetical protein BOX15_Mlig015485g1 [Macrostomum lignano]
MSAVSVLVVSAALLIGATLAAPASRVPHHGYESRQPHRQADEGLEEVTEPGRQFPGFELTPAQMQLLADALVEMSQSSEAELPNRYGILPARGHGANKKRQFYPLRGKKRGGIFHPLRG